MPGSRLIVTARGTRPRLFLSVAALAGALSLSACTNEFASCSRKGDAFHVEKDQSCSFNFAYPDGAKYVVVVTQQPTFGEARGEGKYLKYFAKRGFTGEDRLTIKVERRGVGHVQWQTQVVKVKVGATG